MLDFETINLYKSPESIWAPSLPLALNRGFLFGDGLFETMVMKEGNIRFREIHERRIHESCRVLGLSSATLSGLDEICLLAKKSVPVGIPARIRWNVWRAGLGKYTPETDHISESLHIQPFSPAPEIKASAYISKDIRVYRSAWSHCKTLNALPYVMANLERKERGYDEVILLDVNGFVAEAGASNIFWEKGGELFTPSLSCGCISGIARQAILDHCILQGKPVKQGQFLPRDLLNADSAFTCNVTGISFIKEIEGSQFDPRPVMNLLNIFN